MSQVHLIIIFLVAFLVGAILLAYLLFPALRVAMRKRTLPRVMAHVIVLALGWISLYFVSVLLVYYRLVHFPPSYGAMLAGLAAIIPWEGIFQYWRWNRKADLTRRD